MKLVTPAAFKWTLVTLIIIPIFLFPIGVAVLAFSPKPAYFISQGILAPVTDYGIEGSVNFIYVEEGMTRNLIERLGVWLEVDRPEFTPLTIHDAEELEADFYETESLTYTLQQAVSITSCCEQDDDATLDEDLQQQRLIDLQAELEGYYGNSLGLMVAIGLYEEAHNVRFSELRQEKIAGTGALFEEGMVGTVGALKQKILGAEAANVDLFFIPADYEWFGEFGNEAVARRLEETHLLTMKIVPVQSFDEAVEYLWNS